jgi:hypothetical protein
MLEDYMRIIYAFANRKILPKSWSSFGKYPSDNVSYFTNYLLNKLITINKTLVSSRLKGNKKLKDLISEMIIPHLTTAPKNIFTKSKPIGKIINKKPFLINDSLHV